MVHNDDVMDDQCYWLSSMMYHTGNSVKGTLLVVESRFLFESESSGIIKVKPVQILHTKYCLKNCISLENI